MRSLGGFNDFRILRSSGNVEAISIIPPDLAICDDCLREVLNTRDPRRFRYSFNSCSYCGPRFAVIDSLPYDRQNTSWAHLSHAPPIASVSMMNRPWAGYVGTTTRAYPADYAALG